MSEKPNKFSIHYKYLHTYYCTENCVRSQRGYKDEYSMVFALKYLSLIREITQLQARMEVSLEKSGSQHLIKTSWRRCHLRLSVYYRTPHTLVDNHDIAHFGPKTSLNLLWFVPKPDHVTLSNITHGMPCHELSCSLLTYWN